MGEREDDGDCEDRPKGPQGHACKNRESEDRHGKQDHDRRGNGAPLVFADDELHAGWRPSTVTITLGDVPLQAGPHPALRPSGLVDADSPG